MGSLKNLCDLFCRWRALVLLLLTTNQSLKLTDSIETMYLQIYCHDFVIICLCIYYVLLFCVGDLGNQDMSLLLGNEMGEFPREVDMLHKMGPPPDIRS